MRKPLTYGARVSIENSRTEDIYHGDVIGDDGKVLTVRVYGQDHAMAFEEGKRDFQIAGNNIVARW